MARVPSEKQAKYAMAIAEALGIALPEHETAKEYWQFIQANKDAYYAKLEGKEEPTTGATDITLQEGELETTPDIYGG